jgi:5-methylcytosine-specific restriction endonuclease McrA
MTRHKRSKLCPCPDPACQYRPWLKLSHKRRQAIVAAMVARYGLQCWLCGSLIDPSQVTADHIVPDSRHGGHSLANLRPAHKSCNSARGARQRRSGVMLTRRQWVGAE